jgi:hypothetical protein
MILVESSCYVLRALEDKMRRVQAEAIVENQLRHVQEKITRAVQEMR